MVTAGPGVTNTVTAIANASLARAPVLLIGGCTSRPQANMGPLQDIPHVDILRPVTRTSRTLRVADQVIRELDEAVARAMGDAGEPGPVYLEIPTDVLRTHVPPQLVLDEWMAREAAAPIPPDPAAVAGGGRAVLVGEAAAGHHRPRRRAAPDRRWCGCSMRPARSISTRRKAAASCRPIIPRPPPPCAPPR